MMQEQLQEHIDTAADLVRMILGVIGAIALVYGVWLIYEPVGYIVAGALMIAISMTGISRKVSR